MVIAQAYGDLATSLSSLGHKETPDLSIQTVLSIDVAKAIDASFRLPHFEHLIALLSNYHLLDVNSPVFPRARTSSNYPE